MTGRRWIRVLGLLLAVAVALALAYQVARDWHTLTDPRRPPLHFDARPFLAAWLVQSVGWLLVVATWARIIHRLGGSGRFRQHLRIHTLSSLTNVLPGSVWLPMTRVAGYRGLDVAPVTVGAAMTVEWLLLGIAGLVLYGLAAPFARLPSVVSGLALVVAGGLAVMVLQPGVFAWVLARVSGRLGHGGAAPRLALGDLLSWFIRELAVLVLAGVGLYLVMRGLGPVASLPDAMGATGLTMALANLLAWLPASAILKDASMVVLLTPLYGGAGLALVVVVVWRLWQTVVQLTWAGLAMWLAARGPAADAPPAPGGTV